MAKTMSYVFSVAAEMEGTLVNILRQGVPSIRC